MSAEMISIPRREYEELLEEVGILRNNEMVNAIKESDDAKRRGKPTRKLHL